MTSSHPPRVMVAMSGGVDSSVAAALLLHQGYAVLGVTMAFDLPPDSSTHPTCAGREHIADAQRVAEFLKIPHTVIPFAEHLENLVIADFCREYLRGRTPNPCVRCNQLLKFGILLDYARAQGCDFLATGHYARVEHRSDNLFHLCTAADTRKDQSYFLYRLTQPQLRHVLFPLGSLPKSDVRRLAEKLGLPVAAKPESQEICFISHNDYRAFLAARAPHAPTLQPGDIVDLNGKRLGSHPGAACFTIGQRAGLRIAHSHPLYVVRIDAANNRVIVGARTDAATRSFLVRDLSWTATPVTSPRTCLVKVRYNHPGTPARLVPHQQTILVECEEPVFAVTPGQSAVFYHHDEVLGGGIIADFTDNTNGN